MGGSDADGGAADPFWGGRGGLDRACGGLSEVTERAHVLFWAVATLVYITVETPQTDLCMLFYVK